MSKHTPGPWLVAPDGNVVSGQAGIVERIAVSIFCSKERRDANARLIAAAPQMLEALQKILAVKRTVDLNLFNIEEIHSIAEAALRAADGGSGEGRI